MKVRNVIRGGAVVAASAALASLGTGMGLTSAFDSVARPSPQEIINPGGGCSFADAAYPHPSKHNPGNIRAGWKVVCNSEQDSIGVTVYIWKKVSNLFYSEYLPVGEGGGTSYRTATTRQWSALYNCSG